MSRCHLPRPWVAEIGRRIKTPDKFRRPAVELNDENITLTKDSPLRQRKACRRKRRAPRQLPPSLRGLQLPQRGRTSRTGTIGRPEHKEGWTRRKVTEEARQPVPHEDGLHPLFAMMMVDWKKKQEVEAGGRRGQKILTVYFVRGLDRQRWEPGVGLPSIGRGHGQGRTSRSEISPAWELRELL